MNTPFRVFTADRGDGGQRLDLMLRRRLADLHSATRTRVQTWIKGGLVSINGTETRRVSRRVAVGDIVAVAEAANARPSASGERVRPGGMAAEDLALDVLYEDADLLAVNKPAGIVVHPAYKNISGTIMNALLWRARDWPVAQRPSIVGRLDKLTSGIVLVAKTATAHAALQRAMAAKDANKQYLAVVYGRASAKGDLIELPLRRDPDDRRKVVVSRTHGSPSTTRVARLAFVTASRTGLSLVQCALVTGRMHQIRVHLAARGCPIVGDRVYGEPRWSKVDNQELAAVLKGFRRQALHSWRLTLTHPMTARPLRIEAPLPPDLAELIRATGLSEKAGRENV